MADSELGELRRPPRVLEQRIERTARWRAQGLAGGSSDALFPATANAVSAAAGSEDGASAAGAVWFYDTFNITSATTSPLTLTYWADPNSEVVSLNGVRLVPSVDYTLDGQTLTLLDLTSLRLGIGANTWTLMVSYAYTETVPAAFDPSDFLSWVRNGDAFVSGSNVELTPTSSNKAGSIVCPDVIPSGWSQIDVDLTYQQGDGDGWQVILWDAATHTTAELSATGTKYAVMSDETWPGSNKTTFASNDGTSTISSNVAGTLRVGTATLPYKVRFVKTGANTARIDCYRNDVFDRSSPTDVWVPDTVRIGIFAFTGLLSSNNHTVSGVTLTVGT